VNIPNLITTARLVITVLVFVCLQLSTVMFRAWPHGPELPPDTGLLHPDATLVWIAFVLFLVAAFTDFLDGYLARKWNLVTAFGRVADPFADKILITGSLVMLLQFPAAMQVLTGWYVVVVIAREFLVTAVRGVVEASGQAFPADRLGKYKMVAQCWTVGALMTMVAGTDIWHWAAVAGYWVSLLLTVVSGANYVYKARQVLFGGAL
jgi:CDP-diacylglycerol--glycerol-3-phosphate 3-phosphatidyltransferase